MEAQRTETGFLYSRGALVRTRERSLRICCHGVPYRHEHTRGMEWAVCPVAVSDGTDVSGHTASGESLHRICGVQDAGKEPELTAAA